MATGVAPAGRKRPRARRWTLEPSKKSVAWAKGQEERRQRKHTGAGPRTTMAIATSTATAMATERLPYTVKGKLRSHRKMRFEVPDTIWRAKGQEKRKRKEREPKSTTGERDLTGTPKAWDLRAEQRKAEV